MDPHEPQPLHPNLARIAREHDKVFEAYREGQIDAAKAHERMLGLVAKDDQGVMWRIDPAAGGWLRRTFDGDWVADPSPPVIGVRTPSAADVSAGRIVEDDHVRLYSVDEDMLAPPDTLVGSTRRTTPFEQHHDRRWRRLVIVTVAVVVTLGAAIASLSSLLDTVETLPVPQQQQNDGAEELRDG